MKRTALGLAVTAIAGLAVLPSAAAAGTTTATRSVSATPKPLAGVAVYLSYGKGYPISRYEPGKGFIKLGSAPDLTFQVAASPDGTKLAWVTLDRLPKGKLHIGDGSTSKVVAKGIAANFPCFTPVWSPDSARVAFFGKHVNAKTGTPLMVMNANGTGVRKVGVPLGACHLAWSADGRHLAGAAGDGVFIFDIKTGRSVRVKGIKYANHVHSLSPDARKVVVHTFSGNDPEGDYVWPIGSTPTIVDTVTGKRVPIPVKGTKMGAFYLPDGRLVVRVRGRTHNTLVVLDSTGRELQRLAEPAKARNQALLQIVR